MRRLLYIIISLIITGTVVSSCIKDGITTDSSAQLSFSRDTVSFDTVFTDLGTPTARLLVFNRNDKGVNISNIRFADTNSKFSVNVDGVSGTTFNDVEIRANDSIYIFIECYIPATTQKQPQLVEDKLLFDINGRQQSVLVEAWGRNVTRLRNLTVKEDMTLTAEQPYVIFDSLKVSPGATLKIEPGAQLLFHDKASLTVGGRLEAIGEPGKMIDMRGDRLDNVLPDVGYDILSGQWQGVRILPGSFENRMEYVNMRSTVHGLEVDSTAVTDRKKLTLVNSWLHNSQSTALKSVRAAVDAYGCVFSEAAESVVSLNGGVHNFVQCTLANYYLYTYPHAPLLTLQHVLPEDAQQDGAPLMQATFDNCILYGLSSDIDPGDLTGADVYLRNCLLKSEGKDDSNFINCIWGEDPEFLTIREDYIFDYRVRDSSPAVNAGDAQYVQPFFRLDILGDDRLLATPVTTIGAYAKPVDAPEPES